MDSARRGRRGLIASLTAAALVVGGMLAGPTAAWGDELEPVVDGAVVETAPVVEETAPPAEEPASDEAPAEEAPAAEVETPAPAADAATEETPALLADSEPPVAPMAVGRELTASVTAVTATTASVRVVGSGFDGITGAYAAVIETGTEAGVGMSGGYVGFGYWMTPGAIVGGAFDKTIDADSTKLDRTKTYEVIVWVGHSAPNSDTIYARTPLTLTSQQWDVVDPLPTPQVVVSKTSGLSRDGETITVTGSGFLPNPPATTGTRPPLSGSFGGAYVVFGKFLDSWRPSEGAASANRKVLVQKWGVAAAQFGGSVNAGNGGFVIAADGTFSIQIEVSASEANELLAGNYGIYTYPGSGAAYAPFETYTPLAFAAPGPKISVSKSSGLNKAGETITVTGSGFLPNPPATTGTRPPLSGSFGGAYVVFGKFLDSWRPSTGAPSANRKVLVQKWGVAAAQFGGSVNAGNGGFVIAEDGTFSIQLQVSASEADELLAGNYGIYTYPGSGAAYAPFETYTPLAFAGPPTVSVSKTSGLSKAGETITVTGSGFLPNPPATTGTRPPLSGSFGGAYVVFGKFLDSWRPSEGAASGNRKVLVQKWGVAAADFGGSVNAGNGGFAIAADGTFSIQIEVSASEANELLAGNYGIYTYPGSGAAYAPFETYTPIAFAAPGTNPGTDPGTNPGTNPGTDPGTQPGASVRLSVSPSSLNPAVANTVTVSGSGYTGAGAANGVYVSIGSAASWQPGRVPSEGGWIASAWVTPQQLSGGSFSTTLMIPAGAMVVGQSYGAATFAAHGLALTDRSLDAWAPIALDTTRPATATTGATRTPAATPPAKSGLTVDRTQYAPGGRVTASGTGFQPNETGILVVIYSDPVVLTTSLAADADGVARWSGYLPAGLTGSHTLTFQGSVSVGMPITIAAASAQGCTVDSATLAWGFKETFRSYISGAIANGKWTVSDGASYETPEFSWRGEGSLDPEELTGSLAFPGAVEFTGHGGALDTTIANPRIQLLGDGKAVLLLDVTGTTQSGEPVAEVGVEFADLDLGAVAPEADGEALTFAGIPATLTAAGAAAFGTYPEGEQLDPVTLTVTLAGDCATAAAPTAEASPTAIADAPAAAGPDLAWLWWLLGAIVLIAAIAIAVVVARSRAAKRG